MRYRLNSHAFPAGGEAVLLGQQHVGLFTAGEADDRTQSEQGQNATESFTAHAAKSVALASGACVRNRKQLYSFNAASPAWHFGRLQRWTVPQ